MLYLCSYRKDFAKLGRKQYFDCLFGEAFLCEISLYVPCDKVNNISKSMYNFYPKTLGMDSGMLCVHIF